MSYDGPTNFRVTMERERPARSWTGVEHMPRNTRFRTVDICEEDVETTDEAKARAKQEHPDYRAISARRAKPRRRRG